MGTDEQLSGFPSAPWTYFAELCWRELNLAKEIIEKYVKVPDEASIGLEHRSINL